MLYLARVGQRPQPVLPDQSQITSKLLLGSREPEPAHGSALSFCLGLFSFLTCPETEKAGCAVEHTTLSVLPGFLSHRGQSGLSLPGSWWSPCTACPVSAPGSHGQAWETAHWLRAAPLGSCLTAPYVVYPGWQGVPHAGPLWSSQCRGRRQGGQTSHQCQIRDPLLHYLWHPGMSARALPGTLKPRVTAGTPNPNPGLGSISLEPLRRCMGEGYILVP